MMNWSAIVAEHGPAVWRTVYRLLHHEADARDCFQQTFLAAIEWNNRSPIRDWTGALKRLATVRAIDLLRSRYRWRRQEALPEELTTTLPDPLELAAATELSDRLRMALGDLSPPLATAFALVCLEGFTNVEAAQILEVTPTHLGVLLHRARVELRAKLQEFQPELHQPQQRGTDVN